MIMCGFAITPRRIIPGTETKPAGAALESVPPHAGGHRQSTLSIGSHLSDSDGEDVGGIGGGGGGGAGDEEGDLSGDPRAVHGSEVTMYSHADLGGALPPSIVNRLCMKPAYRVLRKIQKLAAAGRIRGDPPGRTKSEEVLTSLLESSGVEHTPGRLSSGGDGDSAGGGGAAAAKRPFGGGPAISIAYAAAEARRVMALLERMASERAGWVQLGTGRAAAADADADADDDGGGDDMALYKWPIPRTRRVRLGASATVRAAPPELLGLLLESAAMLGPDYVVDGQEMIETLSSTAGTAGGDDGGGGGGGGASSAAAADAGAHDTAIIWFSCTHRRQRMRRDFVVLRCYRPLPSIATGGGTGSGGGLISYASVDHPAFPPGPAYVRGRIEMCGFVVLPHEDGAALVAAPATRPAATAAVTGAAAAVADVVNAVARGGVRPPWMPPREQGSSGGGGAASEVYFYTHLSFSENLPALEDAQASRYLLGPLHILQELRRVVDRTLEYGHSDAARDAAAATANDADGGDGGDGDSGGDYSPEGSDTGDRGALEAKREAALRDLLVLASDGECMDGPQADWRLVRDGGDDGVRLWKCAQPGSAWSMIRTRARLAAPPSAVLDLLLDEARIAEYDDLFDAIAVVARVDARAAFKRTAYKPIWPTAPRDFSLLSSWGTLDDGSAYLVNRSVDHPDCPEVKGFVRGQLMMCGFLMVPAAPRGCTLTMVVHTELGGNLPPAIVNKVSTGAPAVVSAKLQRIFAAWDTRPAQ
ncbi:hypothetical protein JKP88DRAFT_172390 [Tribonema minus]|uniref:START domain-containing protein n=1 Tax=Tribonema minus TaxID=303371 RepID=A0A835YHQ7_9STRA|nr:hypothetical protein JKP88DRAFT_172390 [Tribonema minus]